MNSGFKGSRLGVNSVTMTGSTITYEIAFIGEDGVTHGLMRHSIPAEADSEIAAKADAFITALIKRAASIHFSQPADSGGPQDLAPQKGTYGIAEALGAAGAETDEPTGAQG